MDDHSDDGPASFEDRARTLSESANRARKEIARSSDENRASRLFIMRFVVAVYAGILLSIVAVNVLSGFYTHNWSAVSAALIQLATTMVLPVVTLVLGYYFGREGREAAR